MDIHTAAHYMRSGYRIRRSAWTMSDYIFQNQGVLWITTKSGSTYMHVPFVLSDLLADDWEIDFRDMIDDSGMKAVYKDPPSDEEE